MNQECCMIFSIGSLYNDLPIGIAAPSGKLFFHSRGLRVTFL